MQDTSPIILTENGLGGACAAAAVLLAHPGARLQMTSPYHLPKALETLVSEHYTGVIHLCGMTEALADDVLHEQARRVARVAALHWYAAEPVPGLRPQAARLAKPVSFNFTKAKTDTPAVLAAWRLKKVAQSLLLMELAEEAGDIRAPRSEHHRFCHDLVQAANRRFFFFGDDTLNEQAIRYLAGLEEHSRELDTAVEHYRRSPDELYPLGSSRAMKFLRQRIGRMGPVPEPVLIFGPTGSGKEVMARALHITSGRTGLFIAVNCAVLGGNLPLVEDRLFGHVRGAFTGADSDGKGAFEEAHGGTLFLDEIGELPPEVQAQLLRVLEDKEVRPVGTMKARPVDTRIIAATHRDLQRMVREGRFREDLYYRLNVLQVRVPPLRERHEDMKSIAAHILGDLAKHGYMLSLNKKDWTAIQAYPWPGNVRQFINVLKRAAYMGNTVSELLEEEQHAIDENETGPDILALYCPRSREEVLPAQEIYGAYVKHVLDLFEGNITHTARALEIAPNTLRKLIVRTAIE